VIKIHCDYTELKDVDSIVENPKNANTHTREQIERLAKIVEFQGWRHPLIISKRSGFLCAGHGRLLVAKTLGEEKVPVDFQDFDSEAEEYAFLISDNEIARWATLNEDKLLEDLKEIDLGDIDYLGLEKIPHVKDLQIKESQEIDVDEFGNDLKHICPKCKFEFND